MTANTRLAALITRRQGTRVKMPAQRPFVFINTAITADGKIDTVLREGAAISPASDLERVDKLRAESDAVMVGGHTLVREDPRLTVKSPALRAWRVERGLTENPVKVGIISKIEDPEEGRTIKSEGRFLNTGPARVVVFTSGQTDATQIARLRERGAEVYVAGEQRVDLAEALAHLYDTGIRRLMVEGGGTLNAALLRAHLVDEVHLYVAPLVFGGATAPTLADGPGLAPGEAIQLILLGVEQPVDGGIVIHYRVKGE